MKRQLPSDTIEFHSKKMKVVNRKIVWKIDNFSTRTEQTGEAIESPKFEIVGPGGIRQKWSLQMYPRGCDNANSVSACITLVECVKAEVMAKITFAIQNAIGGNETHKSEMTTTHFTRGQGYKHQIITHDMLYFTEALSRLMAEQRSVFLPNDQLTINCNIDIFQFVHTLE